MLASIFANTHRDSKKKKEPYIPGDFVPYTLEDIWRQEEEEKQTEKANQNLLNIFRTIKEEQRRRK